nr:hypothetical protein [Tanacetum cinerariifolium]
PWQTYPLSSIASLPEPNIVHIVAGQPIMVPAMANVEGHDWCRRKSTLYGYWNKATTSKIDPKYEEKGKMIVAKPTIKNVASVNLIDSTKQLK